MNCSRYERAPKISNDESMALNVYSMRKSTKLSSVSCFSFGLSLPSLSPRSCSLQLLFVRRSLDAIKIIYFPFDQINRFQIASSMMCRCLCTKRNNGRSNCRCSLHRHGPSTFSECMKKRPLQRRRRQPLYRFPTDRIWAKRTMLTIVF